MDTSDIVIIKREGWKKMFAYIKGKVELKTNEYVVIENNNIGYKIYTSLSNIETLCNGQEALMYTYLYVREDAFILYGFINQEEVSLFEQLLSVSGIGPKAAISILSNISVSKFSLAVITDDVNTLTKAQGIGKKTAQRIILELKDKLKKQQINLPEQDEVCTNKTDSSTKEEAISALIMLGYSYSEASKVVFSVYKEEYDLETIIKLCLKGMMK